MRLQRVSLPFPCPNNFPFCPTSRQTDGSFCQTSPSFLLLFTARVRDGDPVHGAHVEEAVKQRHLRPGNVSRATKIAGSENLKSKHWEAAETAGWGGQPPEVAR